MPYAKMISELILRHPAAALRAAWAWIWISFGGIVTSLSALLTLYFLLPMVAHATGLDIITAADVTAGAVEKAADGSIVRMLLLILGICVGLFGAGNLLFLKIIYQLASKPCVLHSEQGQAAMRDVVREGFRQILAEIKLGHITER